MKTEMTGLWNYLEDQRGTAQLTPSLILRAKSEGIEVSLDEALNAIRRMSSRTGEVIAPRFVARLVAELLRAHNVKTVLDPWSYMPWDALQVADALQSIERLDVASINGEAEVWSKAFGDSRVHVRIGKGWSSLQPERPTQYDAIVSLGPIGMRESRTIRATELSDDIGLLEMCSAAGQLSDEGIIAWLVPPRFAFDQSSKSVRQNLGKLGLYLTGWIQLPAGVLLPISSVPFAIAILQKKDFEQLYVVEAQANEESIPGLIQGLLKRKHRGRLANGILIDRLNFYGCAAIQTQETIANTPGWKVGPLTEFNNAIVKVVASKKSAAEFEPLPEQQNAVYLPTMGATRATTAQDRLPTKLKSYLQLIAKPDVAHPEYLAHWFNTEAGQLFRRMNSSGTTIPAISISVLKESSFPLPPLPQQERMVSTQRVVDQMRIELNEAESAIWSSTRSLDEIAGKLPKTDHLARFAGWVETLPFPLASILRHYHAVDRSFKDKRERLLHFFEAFAEFMAIIHLSAYTSDPGRWLLVQDKLKRASTGADLDFRRGSFGLWCTVYNALAKETRAMLNGKDDDKQALVDLYSVVSQGCLEGLVDKGLSQILEAANNMRNRKAHGGAISEAEAEEQHKELAGLLQTVRDRLGSSFYSLQLVQAGSADGLPSGASRVSVRVLTGSNPQFKTQDLELVQHVVKGQLYLLETGRSKALGIAPLVQMKEKEQPACYFYSRLEGGIPQLVSYHFEHRAEEVDNTGIARSFLERLTA
ncbi:MAG: restriction endonuclease subunit S [Flavobacteriales bacterium]|nr:restriction endonuclease subunit S [Flavobacteriales bacterium]